MKILTCQLSKLPLAASIVLLASCSLKTAETEEGDQPGPPPDADEETLDETFNYSTQRNVEYDVFVVDSNGTPVPYATVQFVSTLEAPEDGESIEAGIQGETFQTGQTDVDGLSQGTLVMPNSYTESDLIVHVPGMAGPYTYESLRGIWGPFAPSSRQAVSVSDDSLSIEVTLE